MKRSLSPYLIAVSIVVLGGVTGCGIGSTQTTDPQSAHSTDEPLTLGESAKIGTFMVTVTGSRGPLDPHIDGNGFEFVRTEVDVTVINQGDEPINIDYLGIGMIDAEGQRMGGNFSRSMNGHMMDPGEELKITERLTYRPDLFTFDHVSIYAGLFAQDETAFEAK